MFIKLFNRLGLLLKNPLVTNMLIVGSVTLGVSLLGFYKEILVGGTFGLSEFLDTFTLAILIPSFIQNVFIGAIKNIFIPNYITELKTSKKPGEFQLLILYMITGIVIIFIVLILLFNTFILKLLFSGHTAQYYELITSQLLIVLPCLFFWGYNSFFSALLEISNKFFFTSFTPVFISLATITGVLFFKEQLGDYVLSIGVLGGSLFSFTYLTLLARHFKVIHFKEFRLIKVNQNMKLMIRQLPPKITSGLLTGINPFVDQIFAAQLVVGSVIALSYGNKIPAFGVTIAMVALGNVLLPYFSKSINENLHNAYLELFKILKWIFIGSLVIVGILIFFSADIIRLFFERGAFNSEDTIVVAQIQQILLIHIPFYLMTRILVKFLTSINKNTFMAWISLANMIINVILNLILIRTMGVYGLALSTTIVLILSSIFYFSFTYKQYKLNLINNEDTFHN